MNNAVHVDYCSWLVSMNKLKILKFSYKNIAVSVPTVVHTVQNICIPESIGPLCARVFSA